MSKKLKFYLLFFAVLLGVFYFFIMKDYDFDASPLQVINPAVPAFSFVNQDGKNILTPPKKNKTGKPNIIATGKPAISL